MRLARLTAPFLLVTLLHAAPAPACSPVGQTPEEIIDRADLIARGTVTEVVMEDHPFVPGDFRYFTLELGVYYKDTTAAFAPTIRVVDPDWTSCSRDAPPLGSTYLLVSDQFRTGDVDGWIIEWEAYYNMMPSVIEGLLGDPLVVSTETTSWSTVKARYRR